MPGREAPGIMAYIVAGDGDGEGGRDIQEGVQNVLQQQEVKWYHIKY